MSLHCKCVPFSEDTPTPCCCPGAHRPGGPAGTPLGPGCPVQVTAPPETPRFSGKHDVRVIRPVTPTHCNDLCLRSLMADSRTPNPHVVSAGDFKTQLSLRIASSLRCGTPPSSALTRWPHPAPCCPDDSSASSPAPHNFKTPPPGTHQPTRPNSHCPSTPLP